jgi:hypothetical protein
MYLCYVMIPKISDYAPVEQKDLVFLMESRCVFCEVGTEYACIFYWNSIKLCIFLNYKMYH